MHKPNAFWRKVEVVAGSNGHSVFDSHTVGKMA